MKEETKWGLYSVCYVFPHAGRPDYLLVAAPSEEGAAKRAIAQLTLLNGVTVQKSDQQGSRDNYLDIRTVIRVVNIDGYQISLVPTDDAETAIPDIDLMQLQLSWRFGVYSF